MAEDLPGQMRIMARKLPLDELSTVIARIQGLLLTAEKVDHAVALLARAIKESVDGTTGAGVSLLDNHGKRTSSASTDPIVTRADTLQYGLGQGPCLTAWALRETITIEDVSTDQRWPQWSNSVQHLPLRSVLSTPLLEGAACIGALKVYSDLPAAFGPESAHALELFAAPAATLLANIQTVEAPHRISEALAVSLHSRDLINRACGILMHASSLTDERALAELMLLARKNKVPLAEMAADILAGIPASDD